MTDQFGWGIMGAARIARTAMASAIHAASGAQFVALATRNSERAEPFYSIVPGLNVYDSYEALLTDPAVDGVYIPLPNHLHVSWCLAALSAGKHVLCEKPMAMSAEDFVSLEAAQVQAGRHLAEAYMVLYHPQWHRVRNLLQNGAIGRLNHVEAVFTFANSNPANIRNRADTGGGALRDLGGYPLAVTRFVTGAEPLTGLGQLAARARFEGGVDTHCRARVEFSTFTLEFRVSMRVAPRQEMIFHGTEGWLRLTAPFNAGIHDDTRLELHSKSGVLEVQSFNGVEQYRLMIESFVGEVHGEVAARVPISFSRANQATLDKLIGAASAGC